MMDTAFERQRLPADFTLRIVEAVKQMKIHPMPRTAGLPWGLSLAVGIIVTVLSLNPHVSVPSDIAITTSSPLPVESNVMETGEIPVDISDNPQLHYVPASQVYGNGGGPGISDQQNAVLMAPRGEGIAIPEKPTARLGKGDAKGVRYSPDGKFLLVYGSIGVWLHDAANLDEGWLLDRASSIEFGPDGKVFASYERTLDSGEIPLWDAQERRQIGILQGHTDRVNHVAFSPDGQLLASASGDRTVCLSVGCG